MSLAQNFELPTQQSGEVIPHDRYTPEQEAMFKRFSLIGEAKVAELVTVEYEPKVATVESTGQYL